MDHRSPNPNKRVKRNEGAESIDNATSYDEYFEGKGGQGYDGGNTRFFTVMWRVPQTRKHKTWDSDGYLKVWPSPKPGKKCAQLIDEDSKQVDFGEITQSTINVEDELKVGSHDVSIQSISERAEFENPVGYNTMRPPEVLEVPQNLAKTPLPRAFHLSTKTVPRVQFQQKQPALQQLTSNARSGNNHETGVTSHRVQNTEEGKCYSVSFRKPQFRKNKTWEKEGVLTLIEGVVSLLDEEKKKLFSTKSPKTEFEEDEEFKLGGWEVVINGSLSATEFEGSQHVPKTDTAISPRPSSPLRHSLKSVVPVQRPFKPPQLLGKQLNPVVPLIPPRIVEPDVDQREDKGCMPRPSPEYISMYNSKNLPLVDVVIDKRLMDVLLDHQVEGVKFMYECVMGMRSSSSGFQGCILADQMGLGKTIQAITLVWTLLKQNPFHGDGTVIKRALIVCPKTLLKVWHAEFKKWLGHTNIRIINANKKDTFKSVVTSRVWEVVLMGYDNFRNKIDALLKARPEFGLVICDEGHKIKSSDTQTAKALRRLPTLKRVLLSGTPIQNNVSELHSLMDFVNPGLLGEQKVFKVNFEIPITKSEEEHCSQSTRQVGNQAKSQLLKIIDPYFLKRGGDLITKSLPPLVEYIVFCRPSALQKDIYREILTKDLESETTRADQLAVISLLRKTANSPGLILDQPTSKSETVEHLIKKVKALIPRGTAPHSVNVSSKLLALKSMLRFLYDHSDEKILVVSNFVATLDIIQTLCIKQSYPFIRLDGKTDDQSRMAMVTAFNADRGRKRHFVFLLSSKAGGTGLTITGASRLVLFDPDWNPSNDAQVLARIHRKGQTKPCFIYRLQCAGTLDEKIWQRQIYKSGLASIVDAQGDVLANREVTDSVTSKEFRQLCSVDLDTACNTHDLLGCGCLGPNVENAETANEEIMPPFIMTGSQWQNEQKKETRRKLQCLKQFKHHKITTAEEELCVADTCLQHCIVDLLNTSPSQAISFLFSTGGSQAYSDKEDSQDESDESDESGDVLDDAANGSIEV